MIRFLKPTSFPERVTALMWLVGLLLLVGIVSFLSTYSWHGTGALTEARVEHVGVRADNFGARTLITVRLDDGSVRQVLAPRAFDSVCKAGDRIGLLKRGSSLTVGMRGCHR